jgi:hypothetical protein
MLKHGITVAIETKTSEMLERVYRPDACRLARSARLELH